MRVAGDDLGGFLYDTLKLSAEKKLDDIVREVRLNHLLRSAGKPRKDGLLP